MSIQVSLNGVTEFVHQKSGPAGTANFDGGIPRGPVEGSDSSFTWTDSGSSGLIDPIYLGIEEALRVWSVSITMSGQSTWSLNKISGVTSVELISGTTESTFVLGNQLVLNEGEKLNLVTTGAGTTFVKFAVSISKIDYVGQGTASALITNAIDLNAVHIRGDETVDGRKTFLVSPSVPNPILAQSAANKNYVDSVAATGADPTFAAPVADVSALRAVSSTNLVDRQVRLVEGVGALYRYDENSGANIADDGVGVVKPDTVQLESDGRWYKVTSLIQNHETLAGLLGGAESDHQHLTSDQLAALAGTSGYAVDGSNKLVDNADVRLSDARDPLAHAGMHGIGGADEILISQSQVDGLEQSLSDAATAISLKADESSVVKLTGDQTVDGVKSFTSPLSVPAPVADMDAATKLYVDTEIANVADTLSTLPTADEKAALTGTAGSPGSLNKYVTDSDARLTNDRYPTTHAASHASNGADSITIDQGQVNGLEQSLSDLSDAVSTKAADSDVVKLTGDQFISGVKTFTSSPVLPAPLLDSDAATKKYADDAASSAVGAVSANVPTSDEKAALAGTSGTPGTSNKYVTDADARLSDDRYPTAHAASHASTGSDAITIGKSQVSGLEADLSSIDTALSTKADVNSVVNLVDDQTVGGVKTFTSSPVVPTPVTSGQAATKGYVDDSVTGVAVTFAAPVGTAGDLRAVPVSAIADRQVRLVEDLGALYRYDSSGAGSDDGDGVIKPTEVDVGDTGRWFKTSAATQNHESLTGLEGGDVNDRQHLTTDQVSYIPSSDQKAALAGTDGTPGASNKYVTDTDVRLSDSRTPVAHALSHGLGGGDEISIAQSQVVDLNTALGSKANDSDVVKLTGDQSIGGAKEFTGAVSVPVPTVDGQAATKGYVDESVNTAVGGVSPNVPTADEKAALLGTSGSPGATNKYVTDADTRLSDVREPTGAAGGDLSGTYPSPLIADGAVTTAKIADAAVTDSKIDTVAYTKVTGAPTELPPSGSAGGDLSGTYPNPTVAGAAITTDKIADAAVTDAKIESVAYSKLTGAPDELPPSGPAGGDLFGNYPSPSIADAVVTGSKIASGTITDSNVAAANIDGLANVASMRTLGTGAQQAVAGDDARLSDARDPLAHALSHGAGGSDAITIDQSQVDGLGSALDSKVSSVGVESPLSTTGGTTPTLSIDNSGVAAGSYGSASEVATFSVSGKGLVSSASSTQIQIAQSQVTSLVDDLGAKANKTTTISAGEGLSGGGDLSANRSISMPNVGTAGTYGSASEVSRVTTDAKGRVSSASSVSISIAQTQVTNLVSDIAAKAADSAVVHLTGAETISGVKTFSSSPSVPTPTVSGDAASKGYVDTLAAAVSGSYAAPVQSIAALRAITGAQDKQIRLVEDTGAIFRFDAQASGVDDGSGTIVPTTGGGTWYKVSAATQAHSSLSGLQGGAADDYQHLTTTQVSYLPSSSQKDALAGTSGTPGSANKFVTNADSRLADARTPTSHASTHLPGGSDALTTAAPTTVGTSNVEGTASSFSRSDHVHAHGAQTDGTLHAAATTSVAGFMSAADKTKLDTMSSNASVGGSGTAGQVAYWSSGSAVTSSSKLQWDNSALKLSLDPVATGDNVVRTLQIGPATIKYDPIGEATSALVFDGIKTKGTWAASGSDPLTTTSIRAAGNNGLRLYGSGPVMGSPYASVYVDTYGGTVTNAAERLFVIRNNGVEKASFDKDGALTLPKTIIYSSLDTSSTNRAIGYRDTNGNLINTIPYFNADTNTWPDAMQTSMHGTLFAAKEGDSNLSPRVWFGGKYASVLFNNDVLPVVSAGSVTGYTRLPGTFSLMGMQQEMVAYSNNGSPAQGGYPIIQLRKQRGSYARPFRGIHGDPLGMISFYTLDTDTDFNQSHTGTANAYISAHRYNDGYSNSADIIIAGHAAHVNQLVLGSFVDSLAYSAYPTKYNEVVVLTGTTPVVLEKPIRGIPIVATAENRGGTTYANSQFVIDYVANTIRRSDTSTVPSGSTLYVEYYYNERVQLNGTTSVTLLNKYVNVSGVYSANSGGSTYTRGVDYTLDETNGVITRIPAASGGTIPDGAYVYVVYTYLNNPYWTLAKTLPGQINMTGNIAFRLNNASTNIYTYGIVGVATSSEGDMVISSDVNNLASGSRIYLMVDNQQRALIYGSDNAIALQAAGKIYSYAGGFQFPDSTVQTAAVPVKYNTGVNASIPVDAFAAVTAAIATDVALVPGGGGSLSRSIPDGTNTGGNKRGGTATDWQYLRNAATQVASGSGSVISGGERNTASAAHSTVAGGYGNTASGQYSFTAGYSNTSSGAYASSLGVNNVASGNHSLAVGDQNTVSGRTSVGLGYNNTADSDYSVALGRNASTKSTTGKLAFASGAQGAGTHQYGVHVLRGSSNYFTQTRDLTTDGGAATGSNTIRLPIDSTFLVVAYVVCRDARGYYTRAWKIEACVRNDTTGGYVIVGTPIKTNIASSWAAQDAEYDCAIAVSGGYLSVRALLNSADEDIQPNWVATVHTTELVSSMDMV